MVESNIKIQSIDQLLIQQRLSLLNLTDVDVELAPTLQKDVIAPNVETIIEAFYFHLSQNEQFSSVINQGYDINNLKRTLQHYLKNLGINFHRAEYFHQRLLIGHIHAKVGVQPSLYQCSYRLLQQVLIDLTPVTHAKKNELNAFILKITTLDMSLAIEAYEEGLMANLRTSVQELTDEKTSLSTELATDTLTGALSRRRILEILQYKLDSMIKTPDSVAIIMADLDFFKQINDQYGHVLGDEVLKQTALRIRQAMRSSNSLGRYGGEEFLAVLPSTNLEQALIVANRIRLKVSKDPITSNGHTINLTLSLGVASTNTAAPINSLIDRADKALYQAKHLGRDRVEVAKQNA